MVLRTYDNYVLANIAMARLSEAGIHAFLQDEHAVTALSPFAFDGIKLVVPDAEGPAASAILRLLDEESGENADKL